MAYQLKIDEILEALMIANHPKAAELTASVEASVTQAAMELAKALGVECGAASFEGLGFAGTCCPFFPAVEGQSIPEALEGFDNAEEWIEWGK